MDAVLVAWAGRHGSTRAVAEAIASTIAEHGPDVRCGPARDLREAAAEAGFVVLGGALYNGRWHPEAHRFLKRVRRQRRARAARGLPPLRIAVFGMGPRDDVPEQWARARAQLDRALGRHGWLIPEDVALFGGADPPGGRRSRDVRDWTVIAAWARSLAARAGVGGASSPPGS